MPAIDRETRLPANGSTTVTVIPPRPCGLDGCIGELHVSIKHDGLRIHLNEEQRVALIFALGGIA